MGHLAPKGSRQNHRFNYIEIKGYHYCKSHDFVFNPDEENKKLHQGQPCFYTDSRYEEGALNYYKVCRLYSKKSSSLKSFMRRISKCKNIPVGTSIMFDTGWYYAYKNVDTRYEYKVRKENTFDPNYKISHLSFYNNFQSCEYSKNLVDVLRDNGFLVQVWNTNPHRIYGEEEGEFAIAYGHDKRVGFSSHKNSFRGYQNGCNNILWEYCDHFDKWSRCGQIPKGTPTKEILKVLIGG